MKVVDAVEELRRRYFACKGPRHVKDVAEEAGITRQTLARFGRGGFVSVNVLCRLEDWVDTQEQRRGHHAEP